MGVPRSTEGVWILHDDEITYLDGLGSTLVRQDGHVFMREGEDSDFALLIRRGHVKVTVGNPARIVAIRGPNETVGEMGVLRRSPRSATVIAWNEVEVLYIGAGDLEKFLYAFPRAMFALLLATEDRVAQATRGIADSDLAAERRIAKALVSLIEDGLTERRDDKAIIRLMQKDLASLTGCSIESVKKVVRAFRTHGIIDTRRELLTIANIGALQQIADGKPLASW